MCRTGGSSAGCKPLRSPDQLRMTNLCFEPFGHQNERSPVKLSSCERNWTSCSALNYKVFLEPIHCSNPVPPLLSCIFISSFMAHVFIFPLSSPFYHFMATYDYMSPSSEEAPLGYVRLFLLHPLLLLNGAKHSFVLLMHSGLFWPASWGCAHWTECFQELIGSFLWISLQTKLIPHSRWFGRKLLKVFVIQCIFLKACVSFILQSQSMQQTQTHCFSTL